MTRIPDSLTLDGFLDGKLQILQPRNGYRAATDPVFLAASVPARAGQSVLELGCGVGVASLCLGWRVAGLQQVGIEIQPEYAELARKNAAQNRIPLTVIEADLGNLPPEARQSFDHVLFNPPYFDPRRITPPASAAKTLAHVEETALQDWIDTGFKRLKPRGQMSIIHLAERLPELLGALPDSAGDICILPLAPRTGRDAKRVIVTLRKGSRGATRLLPPFVIHSGDAHTGDGDDYSTVARAVLRYGEHLDTPFK